MQYLSEYTDEQLLALLRGGSEEAFTVLYNRYQKRVYLEASYILKNAEEASDVVQELFAWIWEKRSQFSIKVSFLGYLISSIRHKCINQISKKSTNDKRLKKYFDFVLSDLTNYGPSEIQPFEDQLFEETMHKMTPYAREIFRKMYFERLSQQEIAQQMGVKHQSVRNLVSETMRDLRKYFKKSL